MKKYYTTEDLAAGNIAVKFKKDQDRLTEILKAAFPNDKYWGDYSNMSGVEVNERFYLDYDETKEEGVPSFWWSTNIEPKYDLPTVSEKYILLPGESIPEKLDWHTIVVEWQHSDIKDLEEFLTLNFKCNVKRL
jgi:hypothetical protein